MLSAIKNVYRDFAYDPSVDPERIPAFLDLGQFGRIRYDVHRVDSLGQAEPILPTDPNRTAYFVPAPAGAPMPKPPLMSRALAATAAVTTAMAGIVLGAALAVGSYAGVCTMTFALTVLILSIWRSPLDETRPVAPRMPPEAAALAHE